MPNPQARALGQRIQAARERAGLTTTQVAARITEAGGGPLSETAVRKWETARVSIPHFRLEQLAKVLGTTVAALADPHHAIRAAS